MVRIPASIGVHQVGNERQPSEQNFADAEAPSKIFRLDRDFFMDTFEVSNDRFSRFIECTGYRTEVILINICSFFIEEPSKRRF